MKKEEEYEYRLWIDEIGKENQVKYIKETDKLQDFYRLDNRKRLGNFHIIPDEPYLLKTCSEKINEKLQGIKKKIAGARIVHGNGKGYKDTNIFDYIEVVKDSRHYQMTGFRIAKINDTVIECIENALQFETYDNKYKENMRSYEFYPESLEAGKMTVYEKSENMEKYYYNPHVKFWESDEEICNAFIEFIELNEARVNKDSKSLNEKEL